MMKQDDIPLVQAIPIGPTETVSTSNNQIYFVDLPIGQANLGFQVQGSPPQISMIQKDSPVATQLMVGHYIHGIGLPDIEIVNLSDPDHVMSLIQANAVNPRRLLVSSTPFYVDTNFSSTSGVLYKHILPATSSLGIAMKGFPPVITLVTPTSPLSGRLHPGQIVEALVVPRQPIMNLAAGAFTSAKVEQQLLNTCHIAGRILVVRDGPIPPQEKGTSRALDDCVIS